MKCQIKVQKNDLKYRKIKKTKIKMRGWSSQNGY